MTIRAPTGRTRELLGRLRAALRPRGLLHRRGDPEPLLAELVACQDAGAIRDLLALTMEDSGNHRGCVTALESLAKPLLPDRLPELDEWLRRTGPWAGHWDDGWMRLRPGDVARLSVDGPAALTLIGLCASHPNGRVREAAVKRLAAAVSSEALGFLLVRVNDWVAAIRLRARSALLDLCAPKNAGALLRHLRLVDRLAAAGRADHGDLVAAVEETLQADSARPVLVAGIRARDFYVRRRSVRLLTAALGEPPAWLLEAASLDRDVVVRRWVYDRALKLDDARLRDRLLQSAAADAFAPIRRLALAYWTTREGEVAVRSCRRLLFDRAAGLRADAQRWWAARPGRSLAEVYRDALSRGESSLLVGALCGLGESGDQADSVLVRPFTAHPRARVRRAALRALSRVGSHADVSVFESALLGDRPAVAAEAARCLRGSATPPDPMMLWAKAAGRPAEHRLQLLRAISWGSKWRRLEVLLSAAQDPEPAVHEAVARELRGWLGRYNRSYEALPQDQRTALQAMMKRMEQQLPVALRREISFLIRTG